MIAIYTITFVTALIISSIAAFILIPVLRKVKAGQKIQEDGPVWHMSKQGTPTMGGLIFISGVVVASIAVGMREIISGNLEIIFMLCFALLFALIGFLDDFEKIKKKRNLGLRAWHKILLQLIISSVFILLMESYVELSTHIYIPFFNTTITTPTILYYFFASFVIVGTVNSVNLTDGADGLATGVTIPVIAFFAIMAFIWNDISVGVIATAVTAGLCVFLFFNFNPAKVFMGDTGSMFLGGIVCALAFALDMPVIIVILGFVYFVEALSDIIQVGYYKISKGKRVFKMAPIHHHFEMIGWSERKLFTVFTITSVFFAIIAYFGVFQR
ncbi:MAG: phospho-N-acetylmuramoyl-pentapeptide-transferase [Oscillospiraceae bacterium]|jgi:phospho-N-acetylmuramoyl-pentapeptide-transferase|nr:phospho-N-acetylmuramoyl-pentapeptide-transferase [Oscillospiraceae bacterium]